MTDDEVDDYPNLPEGWPTNYSALTHSELDDYGVVRGHGKRQLDLATRQRMYYNQYLATEEEREARSGQNKKYALIGGGIALVVLVALTVWLTGVMGGDDEAEQPSGPDDSKSVAVSMCQEYAASLLKNPDGAKFTDAPATQSDDDGRVKSVKGVGHGTNGYGGIVPFNYQCTMAFGTSSGYEVIEGSVDG